MKKHNTNRLSKNNNPIITKNLSLSQYADGMAGNIVVWVNLPDEKLAEHGQIIRDIVGLKARLNNETMNENELKEVGQKLQRLAERRMAWLSEIWSKGSEETRISPANIYELIKVTSQTDPRFLEWMVTASLKLIQEYRQQRKKIVNGFAARNRWRFN
jgi:hypothetical protein